MLKSPALAIRPRSPVYANAGPQCSVYWGVHSNAHILIRELSALLYIAYYWLTANRCWSHALLRSPPTCELDVTPVWPVWRERGVTTTLLRQPSAHPCDNEVIATFLNILLFNLPLTVNGKENLTYWTFKTRKVCQNLTETFFGQSTEDYNTMEPWLRTGEYRGGLVGAKRWITLNSKSCSMPNI